MSQRQTIFGFISHLGVPFIARRKTNGVKTLIEFYDARYPHTEFGQFVSRYYADTIAMIHNRGLCLEGAELDWSISADNVQAVQHFLLTAEERTCAKEFSL